MSRVRKVVDAELFGNVVKVYLGPDDALRWWGDDWDDVPYEHNASLVYPEYVSGTLDVAFPSDVVVAEPCLGEINSRWSKEDMLDGSVCMLAACRVDPDERWRYDCSFATVVGSVRAQRLFMGTPVDVDDVESWLGKDAVLIRPYDGL